MKQVCFHAMGSQMLAVVDSDAPDAVHLLEQVPSWFEQWEQILSRFRFDSELSCLNRSAGHSFLVSQVLWEVFHAAREMETWTGGLVRPTVLNAMLQAGYDRSFELILEKAGGAVKESALPDPSTAIGWDATQRSLLLPLTVNLDFGGFAKGWAARQAMERLATAGPALMDAGGDIASSGPRTDGSPWPVGIRDPFHPEKDSDILKLGRCGLATSGTDYHRWQQAGKMRHHIIDPRNGFPAETDILTATVIAPDTLFAEAAAKTALILGSDAALDWLEADPSLAGALTLENGDVLYSRQMELFLWK